MNENRRTFLWLVGMGALFPFAFANAQESTVWSAEEAYEGLKNGDLVLIDVRSRGEWADSGVAEGAWPISMHEPNFPQRLFKARELAGERKIGLICTVGGRSGSILRAVRKAGYEGFVDVSEGMMGSKLGRGWITKKLPIVSAKDALSGLPGALR